MSLPDGRGQAPEGGIGLSPLGVRERCCERLVRGTMGPRRCCCMCVCVSVAVPERSLRQRGGIVYVGLLWDVGLCWFWGRTGCPQGGGTAFTGLYPAAGPEGPSWSGSRACVRVSVAAARVFQNHQAPSFDFWLNKEILKRQPLALSCWQRAKESLL